MMKSARPRKLPAEADASPKLTASAVARMQRAGVLEAVGACESKKGFDIALLELEKGSSAFTDYFVICSGSNPRQMQAISDEVEQRLRKSGTRPQNIEGYNQADWILLDYVDFIVHIFSENARKFYDLERLWKSAKRYEMADLQNAQERKPARKRAAAGAARRTVARKPPAPARKKK
jgi:ribosome-associated protein